MFLFVLPVKLKSYGEWTFKYVAPIEYNKIPLSLRM